MRSESLAGPRWTAALVWLSAAACGSSGHAPSPAPADAAPAADGATPDVGAASPDAAATGGAADRPAAATADAPASGARMSAGQDVAADRAAPDARAEDGVGRDGATGAGADAGAGYDRTEWRATSTPPPGMTKGYGDKSLAEAMAFDGDRTTRWSTAKPQMGGETFVVDFKRPLTFTRIVLDAGAKDGNDYPRSWQLFVSNDGAAFGSSPIAMATEKKGPLTVLQVPATTARFVKIVDTGMDKQFWWAIGEMNVYP